MPPFDREGALKTAEKALRQGRIDAAIAEYVRIVAAQPRDWNSANIEQGHTAKAVEWFERAAEAPAPTPDASRALLYDLAETLENLGEHGRALAVIVELKAESGGYRDVAHRIERLSKAKAKR
jgi:hypothetical protein